MQFAASIPGPQLGKTLRLYYDTLYQRFGAQRWWPARTRLEVILGAILTQNTAWRNAALALKELRKSGLLNLQKLGKLSSLELEAFIRSAGFYRQKAATIRSFLDWLHRAHAGSLRSALASPADVLRRDLLSVKGIGPETADAILLYAARQPSFVADAYTRRVLQRHSLIAPREGYAGTREFLHRHLPADHLMFNEFHALLVEVGKRYCQSEAPRCEGCPLREFLPVRTPAFPSLSPDFDAGKPRQESRGASA